MTITYWFGEDEYEFYIPIHDVREAIREYLSDCDKNTLIDFIINEMNSDDLFGLFEEQLMEKYEDVAYMYYKENK